MCLLAKYLSKDFTAPLFSTEPTQLYSASPVMRGIHSTISCSLGISVSSLYFPSVLLYIEGDKLTDNILSCWGLVSRPFLIFCYKCPASVIHAHRHHYSALFVWEHSQTAEKAARKTHKDHLVQNVAAIHSSNAGHSQTSAIFLLQAGLHSSRELKPASDFLYPTENYPELAEQLPLQLLFWFLSTLAEQWKSYQLQETHEEGHMTTFITK